MLTYAEIKKMKEKDIIKNIQEKTKELVNLRFQIVSNQLKDLKQIKKTKKEIARLKTRQNMLSKGETNE